jgi:heat shock 70kDa protein 4
MRAKVASNDHLCPYGSDREKDAFLAKNEAMENWLYEDGFDATKNVDAEKLAEPKKLGGPLERRQCQSEATRRPAALESPLRTNSEH